MSAVKCKNCGNTVNPKLSGGQVVLGILLLLLFIIPGAIYLLVCSRSKCPSCGKNVYKKKEESA